MNLCFTIILQESYLCGDGESAAALHESYKLFNTWGQAYAPGIVKFMDLDTCKHLVDLGGNKHLYIFFDKTYFSANY